MPSAEDRRARVAITVVFFVTGFVVAAWATRIPEVQQRLALSPGTFAIAVLGLEGGAIVGLPAGGALVAQLGGRASLRLGFALYPTALVAVALAPSLGWLVAALAVMAAANSVIDVAMNVQGVELQRRYRRSLLSGLHAATRSACWRVGWPALWPRPPSCPPACTSALPAAPACCSAWQPPGGW
jgi:MFS family permease